MELDYDKRMEIDRTINELQKQFMIGVNYRGERHIVLDVDDEEKLIECLEISFDNKPNCSNELIKVIIEEFTTKHNYEFVDIHKTVWTGGTKINYNLYFKDIN